jgi:HAD superfamily hydrolase (TIGR01549 family)
VPRAVLLDVGETNVDETRLWTAAAERLGVSPFTVMGAVGATIGARVHHREALRWLRADRDLDGGFDAADLYPDALPALRALRERGLTVGLAGNQPQAAEAALAALGLPVDVVVSSASLGVAKPDPAFFARLVDLVGLPAAEIAYVGDRVDNDVVPAADAGLVAIHLRRGPWGVVHATWPEAGRAAARIETLAELPAVLATI